MKGSGRAEQRNLIIREAKPEDAEQITTRSQELAREPGAVIRESPEIPTYTAEQTRWMAEREREKIACFSASDNSLMLVAEVGGEIVGVLEFEGGACGTDRHTVGIGISVKKDRRNQGIGSDLLARAIEWAKGTGTVKRVLLNVMTANAPAIQLYEKFGFEVHGQPFHARGLPDDTGPELIKMVLRL